MEDTRQVSLRQLARALGGDVGNGEVLAPGPGHSAGDRSLSVKLDSAAPDGFLVHSFAGDDPIVCRDYVRQKLGLPEFEPNKKRKKADGGAKPFSVTTDKYVYRLADGTPYLQVHRLADKSGFPQYHWNGEKWDQREAEGAKSPLHAAATNRGRTRQADLCRRGREGRRQSSQDRLRGNVQFRRCRQR